jgi:hypothetical protein
MKVNKNLEDRNNMIRIQYDTEDKVPSSITIDPTTYNLINAQVGEAKKWFKETARAKRSSLLRQAEELASDNKLFKRDSAGVERAISPEEFIRGKISAAVRDEAIKAIARPELLAKANIV